MVTVEEVISPKDLARFVEIPYRLYKNDPNWVPPLRSEVKSVLDKKKNPFWQHSEGKLFLARKNGEDLGRIAAMVDRNFIDFHNRKIGYFGFFEAIEDYEIAEALFQKTVEYQRAMGMERFYGPMNPSTNDECGFLLEGFVTPPFIMMTHTHKYYLDFAERFGFTKAKDLYALYVDAKDAPIEYLERIASMVKKRIRNLVVRPVNLKRFDEEIKRIREVYNDAWARNWGFVPMTSAEFEDIARRLKPLIVPGLVLIAEIDGKPVAVSLGVPNYNEVLIHLNGRLGLAGILKFLYYRGKIRQARMVIMGVKKEYRRSGIEAIFFLESFRVGKKLGYTGGELSWTLEDNDLVNRPSVKMGGKIYKKYRIFEYVT